MTARPRRGGDGWAPLPAPSRGCPRSSQFAWINIRRVGGHGSKGLRAGRCIETAGPFRVADEEGGPGKGGDFIPAALVKYGPDVLIPPLACPQAQHSFGAS